MESRKRDHVVPQQTQESCILTNIPDILTWIRVEEEEEAEDGEQEKGPFSAQTPRLTSQTSSPGSGRRGGGSRGWRAGGGTIYCSSNPRRLVHSYTYIPNILTWIR
jgi:hypothetical protein